MTPEANPPQTFAQPQAAAAAATPPGDFVPQTPLQRLLLERALTFARQLETAAADAPHGTVLDRCEKVALDGGRDFLRLAVADALQARIDEGEKKGPRPAPVLADRHGATRAARRAPS